MPLNPPMQYSKLGEEITEKFESCALASYQDIVGVWTLGYGHTSGVGPNMTCTSEQAQAWLLDDTQEAANAVNQLVNVTLTQAEFDALVDFVFNLGAGAFAGSTLLQLLNNGNYQEAADQFDRWDHAGGQVVSGLLRRREAEKDEFNGITPTNGVA